SLKWLLQKDIIAIPKSANELHIKENFDLNFSLSEEDIREIDSIKIHERLVDPGFSEFDY
ncbi:MAG: aldo/keto reductase, partial [Nanoarchaeota archaeon]